MCIEELKRPAKEAGVKSLPHAVLYDPAAGRGRLVGIDVPPSKVKNLKVNLLVSLGSGIPRLRDCQGVRHPLGFARPLRRPFPCPPAPMHLPATPLVAQPSLTRSRPPPQTT